MSAINLSDYVAAGYFITKYTSDGFWHSSLMPERVISVSACIGKPLQVYWGSNIEKYREEALNFGIPAEKLEAMKNWFWVRRRDPFAIYTLDDARRLIRELPSLKDKLVLVGIGLHRDLMDDFLGPKEIPWLGSANPHMIEGHFVEERHELEQGGEIRGFEIVSIWYSLSHSWLCAGLEKDMHELFGIQPNQYGLIDTYEEAKKVYDWIAEDDMQGHRGEPEPYYPWLIVQYPLAAQSGQ